jgi:hypothetical protein
LLEKHKSLDVFAGEENMLEKPVNRNDTVRAILTSLPTQHPDTKEPNL